MTNTKGDEILRKILDIELSYCTREIFLLTADWKVIDREELDENLHEGAKEIQGDDDVFRYFTLVECNEPIEQNEMSAKLEHLMKTFCFPWCLVKRKKKITPPTRASPRHPFLAGVM